MLVIRRIVRDIVTGRCTISTLRSQAATILQTSDPHQKAVLAQQLHQDVCATLNTEPFPLGPLCPDVNPARPEHLICVDSVPSYKQLGVAIAPHLLHYLAHVEVNAIDLFHDAVCRFDGLPASFCYDMVRVAADEARHFVLLAQRLTAHGCPYGALPVKNHLWDDAERTKHDVKARLVLVHLVDEAQALDSVERLVQRFRSCGDRASADLIAMICSEEEEHVRTGVKWFQYLCDRENLSARDTYRTLYSQLLSRANIRTRFNDTARMRAGLPQDWYR
eukprot:TRINITY_DN12989_c0_g1_i1.p1 TRINITY_DN12989_c0_g1~~TRINITY_DN12989_c0_g1_i1.p1  ORF type:complete len:277 (-),score=53.94 TRINITY_DN12989_c0_g1_i1:3-833(-)